MLLLWQDPGPPGLSLSILGVADDSRGAVGVWAEQGCDGVVAMARVVGCENHIREFMERGNAKCLPVRFGVQFYSVHSFYKLLICGEPVQLSRLRGLPRGKGLPGSLRGLFEHFYSHVYSRAASDSIQDFDHQRTFGFSSTLGTEETREMSVKWVRVNRLVLSGDRLWNKTKSTC